MCPCRSVVCRTEMVTQSCAAISAARSHDGDAIATLAPPSRRRKSRRLGELKFTADRRDFDDRNTQAQPYLQMNLQGLDHVAIAVADVARSAQWYIEVLGLERLHGDVWKDVPLFVGKGETGIAIFPARES